MIQYNSVKAKILDVERVGNTMLSGMGELIFALEQFAKVNYNISITCKASSWDEGVDSLTIDIGDTSPNSQLVKDLHRLLKDTRIIRWNITTEGEDIES